MGKTKIIEVSITSLKITHEDHFLKRWVSIMGNTVDKSPQYLYLKGNYELMADWMSFRGLDSFYLTQPMMKLLQSLVEFGQKEPIKIYKDMRINTGHKRAACMLFLGYKNIKAIIVPEDLKL